MGSGLYQARGDTPRLIYIALSGLNIPEHQWLQTRTRLFNRCFHKIGKDLFLEGNKILPDIGITDRSKGKRKYDALACFNKEAKALNMIIGFKKLDLVERLHQQVFEIVGESFEKFLGIGGLPDEFPAYKLIANNI